MNRKFVWFFACVLLFVSSNPSSAAPITLEQSVDIDGDRLNEYPAVFREYDLLDELGLETDSILRGRLFTGSFIWDTV